jgi:hypothetical protein
VFNYYLFKDLNKTLINRNTMDERQQRLLDEVEAALDSGFKSKSQKNEATSKLGRIWERITDKISSAINDKIWDDYAAKGLTTDFDEFGNLPAAYIQWQETFAEPEREKGELPMSLSHVRDKHLEKIRTYFPEHYEDVLYIKNLLDTIKTAEVTPLPPKSDPLEKKVEGRVKSLFDQMAKRQQQFTDAVEMGKLFGGLPVSAYAHWGRSKYGRDFVRVFYYLNGRVTPLSVIIAAAQALEDKGKKVPILQDSEPVVESNRKGLVKMVFGNAE